jgi:hypothetical protein
MRISSFILVSTLLPIAGTIAINKASGDLSSRFIPFASQTTILAEAENSGEICPRGLGREDCYIQLNRPENLVQGWSHGMNQDSTNQTSEDLPRGTGRWIG